MAENLFERKLVDVLANALEHPFGHEIVSMVYEMRRSVSQLEAQNTHLIAIALKLSRDLELNQVPYFKAMSAEQINQWIAQHS